MSDAAVAAAGRRRQRRHHRAADAWRDALGLLSGQSRVREPGDGTAVQIGYVLCDTSGTTQRKWTVGPAPTSLPPPVIGGPLFECAGVVRVTNLRPGSRVQVTSDVLGGAPLGEAYATASEADVA